MIVVIADDLSGAAELAGAALNHGLTAEVQTRFCHDVPSRVVCIDMEGRAASPEMAKAETNAIYRTVTGGRPEWIFFKFDSVLRGNIVAQLEAALEISGHARAMLITANPSRGRTILGGEYLIDGTPLHRTPFANDPLFPCRSSSVRALLGSADSRIVTPDIETTGDLDRWARTADASTLLAGSAEFFEALLRLRAAESAGHPEAHEASTPDERAIHRSHTPSGPTLLVCGSRASWRIRVVEAGQRGIGVFDILDDPREAAATLVREGSILLGVGERVSAGAARPSDLLDRLGDAVAEVCARVSPTRLLLEGGATAAMVVNRMGWSRLICQESVGRGVASLRPPDAGADPLVLIKPGSYPWPAEIW